MEINCGSVSLTTLEQSLLMGEAALMALLVSAMVKAQLAAAWLTQEYMKLLLLTNQPKLKGDQHTAYLSKPVDAETTNDDEDGEEDDDDNDNDNASPVDDSKSGAKNGPGGVGENGEDEDDEPVDGEDEEPDEDGEDDEDGGDDEDEDDDDDDDGGEVGEEDEEEEDGEEDEEEAIQPPKKRKK